MKSIKMFALVALLLTAAFGSTAFINTRLLKTVAKSENKGFAVVELFTSEGCSSCPPADQLIAKIQKEDADKPVYILAFHVDYWNSLGWKDGFSSADYSKRQRDYASYLHLESVYTPQAVVNGKTEFVGSEEGTLRGAIQKSLSKTPEAKLTISAPAPIGNKLPIAYTTEGANKTTSLLIAMVEKNAQTKVERGENGGRTLSHVQIVRKLQKVNLNTASGSTVIALPPDFDARSWEVIGILQDTSTGEITAAAKMEPGVNS
jgi:hypothetical protein